MRQHERTSLELIVNTNVLAARSLRVATEATAAAAVCRRYTVVGTRKRDCAERGWECWEFLWLGLGQDALLATCQCTGLCTRGALCCTAALFPSMGIALLRVCTAAPVLLGPTGAYGTVYKGTFNGRAVAVKVLTGGSGHGQGAGSLCSTDRAVAHRCFFQEARALRRCSHRWAGGKAGQGAGPPLGRAHSTVQLVARLCMSSR